MANQRSVNQRFIGTWCEDAFVAKIEAARLKLGLSLSQFCLSALADRLRALGYEIPESILQPPDRAGKGGPTKPVRHSIVQRQLARLIEARGTQTSHPASTNSAKSKGVNSFVAEVDEQVVKALDRSFHSKSKRHGKV